MSDPSAGRPSTPPEEQFTEEDVALVADALYRTQFAQTLEDDARAALTALAAAGRLLPPDAEHHEEWGALMRFGDHVIGLRRDTVEEARSAAKRHRPLAPIEMTGTIGERTIITGPWVEVDRSATADA